MLYIHADSYQVNLGFCCSLARKGPDLSLSPAALPAGKYWVKMLKYGYQLMSDSL